MLEVLIAILAVQQVLDVYTTSEALKTGRAKEVNPLVRGLMDRVGVMPALVSIKLAFMGLIWYTQSDHWLYLAVLGWAVVFYAILLKNNFHTLSKIRS